MDWEEQKSNSVYFIIFHLPTLPQRPRSSTRFVAIIEDNLQYNLVCSFLKWSDNISPDHQWNGSGRFGGGLTVEEEEGWNRGMGGGGIERLLQFFSLCGNPIALAFMTSCLTASSLEFTNHLTHTHTHNWQCRHSVIRRNKYQQYKRSAKVDRRGRSPVIICLRTRIA